jgi:alpha-1,3-mannosyltransferase
MSALLYAPGLLVILFKMQGLINTLHHCIILVLVQGILAKEFLEQAPLDYFNSAFEFSRVFMYKWTVNWRFVEEQTFISRPFALTLLAGQITVLIAFGLFRWCRSDGGVFSTLSRGLRRPSLPANIIPVTPDR